MAAMLKLSSARDFSTHLLLTALTRLRKSITKFVYLVASMILVSKLFTLGS